MTRRVPHWLTGAGGRPPGAALLLVFLALVGLPARASEAQEGGRMILVRTSRTLPLTGDPIWELRLHLPDRRERSYEAVVGRAAFQEADRNVLGSRSPLPPGLYAVTEIEPIQPQDSPELGRFVWIGLEPRFGTDRRALGIHHDPSAGRGRQSGTEGCIGLIHGNDLLNLARLLEISGTRDLLVRD